MIKIKSLGIIILTAAILFSSGCATIIDDPTQVLPISSDPSDAAVVIKDETQKIIFKDLTPTRVTLEKSDGSYFGGKDYIVSISKEGYHDIDIPVRTTPSGWYIAGNFIFGGLIGWLIVDPLTGSMWTLSPDKITAVLSQKTSYYNHRKDGSIHIVLLQDVPAALRTNLIRVN